MKLKKIMTGLLGPLLLLAAFPVHAVLLSFDATSWEVSVGETMEVGVTASGLTSAGAPSLSEFDLTVGFDSAVLGLTAVSFGDPVQGDQLDLFGFGSITDYQTPEPGVVTLYELSLDFPWDLEDLQLDSFTLATLTFAGTAPADTALSLAITTIGDAWGDPILASAQGTTISVVSGHGGGPVTTVPEPPTQVLLLTGMLLLLFGGRGHQVRVRAMLRI